MVCALVLQVFKVELFLEKFVTVPRPLDRCLLVYGHYARRLQSSLSQIVFGSGNLSKNSVECLALQYLQSLKPTD